MSVQIVTGYTGERHITPYMDAVVNRSLFTDDGSCILSEGSQMSASMPDINTFVIADGAFAIQGHIGITNGETLTVDTCASGSRRIDLVVARFEHNSNTNIDTMSIVLLKGEETTSQYPTTPTYRTGTIADGANADMPLYRINLNGSTVTFSRIPAIDGGKDFRQFYSDSKQEIVLVGNDSKETGIKTRRTDTGVGVGLMVGTGGTNHGVYSEKENKWIIYNDANGITQIPSTDIRLAGHSSSIGKIVEAYSTSAKTCVGGRWYALCSIVLDAGVWVVTAGARWNPPSTINTSYFYTYRAANISQESGNSSLNITTVPVAHNVTNVKFTQIVAPASSTRYYLNVFHDMQNDNIVCPVSGAGYGNFIRAVRIK